MKLVKVTVESRSAVDQLSEKHDVAYMTDELEAVVGATDEEIALIKACRSPQRRADRVRSRTADQRGVLAAAAAADRDRAGLLDGPGVRRGGAIGYKQTIGAGDALRTGS